MAVKVLSVDYFLDNKVSFKTAANIKVLNATTEIQAFADGDEISVTNIATVQCFLDGDPSHKDESRREDKEYPVYMLIGPDGTTASTSSQTLIDDVEAFLSLDEVAETVKDGGFATIALKKIPSKNRSGSHFFRAELLNVVTKDGEIIG